MLKLSIKILLKTGKKLKMNVIAIDGSSATGTGTLGSKLAQVYDFAYLDTGALYRGVAFELLNAGVDVSDEKEAVRVAKSLSPEKMLSLQNESGIRNETCGKAASVISAFPAVREALFDFQRRFAENPIKQDGTQAKGAILDGRDIGTVICPEAKWKVFLTASAEIRAKRRFKELQFKGLCVIYDDVLSDIQARDKRDSERSTAPLRPADDAFILDTSDLTADDVYARVVDYMNERNKQVPEKV